MWSRHSITAGTGSSMIPEPVIGSAEKTVMYVDAPSMSTYSA
jgi:hypothetical protein